jgi:hypothetical protein
MIIPPSERAKLARHREFQSRVLAALEKPKRGRMTFILSNLICPALVALLISFGGLYYASAKQCIADSKQLVRDYGHVRDEVRWRRTKIAENLLLSQTLKDARARLLNVGYDDADFRDRSFVDLLIRMRALSLKIDFSGSRPNPTADSVRSLDDLIQSEPTFVKFQTLVDGGFPESLSPSDQPALQAFGYAMFLKAAFEKIGDFPILTTFDCGPHNVVKIMLGGEPQTVRMSQVTFLEFQKARDLARAE